RPGLRRLRGAVPADHRADPRQPSLQHPDRGAMSATTTASRPRPAPRRSPWWRRAKGRATALRYVLLVTALVLLIGPLAVTPHSAVPVGPPPADRLGPSGARRRHQRVHQRPRRRQPPGAGPRRRAPPLPQGEEGPQPAAVADDVGADLPLRVDHGLPVREGAG